MADPGTTLAAIDFALKGTALIIKYAKGVLDSLDDMEAILREVHHAKRVLEPLQGYYKQPQKDMIASELDSFVREAARSYGLLFNEIADYMQRVSESRRVKALRMFQWPLVKSKFQSKLKGLNELDRRTSNLRLVKVEQILDEQQDVAKQARFQDCLERLYSTEQLESMQEKSSIHLNNCRNSAPDWVFDTLAYRSWLKVITLTPALLWALGEAGAGKSCIAAYLAHQLPFLAGAGANTGQASAETAVVASFHCNYTLEKNQSLDTILKCLCRQFLGQLWDTNPDLAVRRSNEAMDMLSSSNDPRKLTPSKLLDNLCYDFSASFIIIDALDECTAAQDRLLKVLKGLNAESLKIFITSRDGHRQTAQELDAFILEAEENDAALRLYIANRLENIVLKTELILDSNLPNLLQDPNLRVLASQAVCNASRNNFLCAELQISTLQAADDEDHLKAILSTLKSSVRDLVEEAIRRVSQGRHARIGLAAMMWTIYGLESLTLPALKHAIALTMYKDHDYTQHMDDQIALSRRVLRESTAFLLNISDDSPITVHKAIYDCCQSPNVKADFFASASHETAEACLTVLQTEYFGMDDVDMDEWQSQLEKMPFLTYAAAHWGHHVREVLKNRAISVLDTSGSKATLLEDLVLNLLEQPGFVKTINFGSLPSFRSLGMLTGEAETCLEQEGAAIFLPVHFITLFEMHTILTRWTKEGGDVNGYSKGNSSGNCGFTALWLACRIGSESTAMSLLKCGADPIKRNGIDSFILNEAASRGLLKVVQRIAKMKSVETCLKQADSSGVSALVHTIWAPRENKVKIFEALLRAAETTKDSRGIIFQKNHWGDCTIHHAARANQAEIATMLGKCSYGKELLAEPGNGGWAESPLHVASHYGHSQVIGAMLEAGAQGTTQHRDKKTPLHICANQNWNLEGRAATIRLLAKGTDPLVVDLNGNNAAHLAASLGVLENLDALLSAITDQTILQRLLRQINVHGRSPLAEAAETKRSGRISCFNRILKEMSGINDKDFAVVISLRRIYGDEIVVPAEMFQDSNPWDLAKTDKSLALHVFIETGSVEIVSQGWEELKNSNPSVLEARDSEGRTPLHLAAFVHHEAIVRFLLTLDVSIDAQDNAGKTALHHAVEQEAASVVSLLLSASAQQDIKDNTGLTPAMRCSSQNACAGLLNHTEPSSIQPHSILHSKISKWMITVGDANELEWARHHQLYIRGDMPWYHSQSINFGTREQTYLTSPPLPPTTRLPVTRIECKLSGRDQGWSSDEWFADRGVGTFTSDTGYSLAILRDENIIRRLSIGRNKHRWTDFHVFEAKWSSVENENEAKFGIPVFPDQSGDHPNGPATSQMNFVKALRPGDKLVLLAEAAGAGWLNITRDAEIVVFES